MRRLALALCLLPLAACGGTAGGRAMQAPPPGHGVDQAGHDHAREDQAGHDQAGHDHGDASDLALARALRAGDTVYAELRLGVIAPGQEIEVTTPDGRTLGVISPHGVRAGTGAGTYTLPLPADAVRENRVALRVRITRAGAAPRAPSADELRALRIVVTGEAPPSK